MRDGGNRHKRVTVGKLASGGLVIREDFLREINGIDRM